MAISQDKLKRELEAQKARVVALQYLESRGQGNQNKTLLEFRESNAKANSDNTLELLLKERASKASSQGDVEKSIKMALLQQQSHLKIPLAMSSKSTIEVTDGSTCTVITSNGDQWKKSMHAASRQECWVNLATGETKFEDPTMAAPNLTNTARAIENAPVKGSSSGQSKKRGHKDLDDNDIDPLDPTMGKGEHGRASVGKMADSTASGPLWQQRPYPAPGKALLMQKQQRKQAGPIFVSAKK